MDEAEVWWDSWLIERSGWGDCRGESESTVIVILLELEMLGSMTGARSSWVAWREGGKRGLLTPDDGRSRIEETAGEGTSRAVKVL